MAMFGSNFPGQVGLRLLISPLGSNIVIRTACCSVGTVIPVYSTFKAIESRDEDEERKWLLYWAAYGSFSIVEMLTDKFLYRFPFYYHMKFAFLVWLQLPTVEGARHFYRNVLRPFLRRHQRRLDQFLGFFYSEMAKFVSTRHAEMQFTKAFLLKILGSVSHMVQSIIHPGKRQRNGTAAIEGPPEHVETSEPESESEDEE